MGTGNWELRTENWILNTSKHDIEKRKTIKQHTKKTRIHEIREKKIEERKI